MFIDRERTLLLGEGELRRDLHYPTRSYSYANKDAFLAYLRELDARDSGRSRLRRTNIRRRVSTASLARSPKPP